MLGQILPLGQLAINTRRIRISKAILNHPSVMCDDNPKLKIYVVLNGIYEQRCARVNSTLAHNLA